MGEEKHSISVFLNLWKVWLLFWSRNSDKLLHLKHQLSCQLVIFDGSKCVPVITAVLTKRNHFRFTSGEIFYYRCKLIITSCFSAANSEFRAAICSKLHGPASAHRWKSMVGKLSGRNVEKGLNAFRKGSTR